MSTLEASVEKVGGREYPIEKPLVANTGEITEGGESSGNQTFGQSPSEMGTNESGLESGSALWFPDDLGTAGNAHYVKFEVYLLDTGKGTAKVQSDGEREVGFDATGQQPRFASNLNNMGGQTRNTSLGGTLSVMKRLNEIIALPMPDGIVTDYSTSWSRSEGGAASNLMSIGDQLINGQSTSQGGIQALKAVALGAASGVAGMLSSIDINGAETHMKLLTKRAPNPRNEFLFDGVNNRSFNFQWKFFPRSEKEAKTLRTLIEKFKLYMHPELDQSTSGNFYLFPALFDITFMNGNSENEWLYRTSTCALTNMITNFTGAGQWVATGDDGAPVGVDVTLQMTEIEFLHRDRFKTKSNPNGVAR